MIEAPTELDFLISLGLEPTEVDASMGYRKYVVKSGRGDTELELSFSVIASSFQVVLRHLGEEMMSVSSENVSGIDIRRTQQGHEVHVRFGESGRMSEAEITIEPRLHCLWWSLRA